MIDFKRKIILVHPPRCGGTTIEDTLFHPDGYFTLFPWMKHRSLSEYIQIVQIRREDISSYRVVGLTRNPCERLQSMYGIGYWKYQCTYPNKLERFFEGVGFARFISLVQPMNHEGKNLRLVDYFDCEYPVSIFDISKINELQETLGISAVERMQVTPSNSKPELNYISRSVLAYRFREDFQRFDYSLNGAASKFVGGVLTGFYAFVHRTSWSTARLLNRKTNHTIKVNKAD